MRTGKALTGGTVCGPRGRGEDWAWKCQGKEDRRWFVRALLFVSLTAAVVPGGSPCLLVSTLARGQLRSEQTRLKRELRKSRPVRVSSRHESCGEVVELTLPADESL